MNLTADMKSYRKQYYKAHKEDILKGMSKIIKCEACNCDIQKQWKLRHEKTYKHQRNQDKLDNPDGQDDQISEKNKEVDKIKKKLDRMIEKVKMLNENLKEIST